MLIASDFHTALNQLMHRASLGEEVVFELDDLVAYLERAKASLGFPRWRDDLAKLRGSLMVQLVGLSAASGRAPTDSAENRKRRFIEASMARLARLLGQAA